MSVQLGSGRALEDEFIHVEHRGKEAGISRDVLLMEAESRANTATWNCGLTPNAKGGRYEFTIDFSVQDFGQCTIAFSAKVYGASAARHAGSGNGLKSVIADFRSKDEGAPKLLREQWLTA